MHTSVFFLMEFHRKNPSKNNLRSYYFFDGILCFFNGFLYLTLEQIKPGKAYIFFDEIFHRKTIASNLIFISMEFWWFFDEQNPSKKNTDAHSIFTATMK